MYQGCGELLDATDISFRENPPSVAIASDFPHLPLEQPTPEGYRRNPDLHSRLPEATSSRLSHI